MNTERTENERRVGRQYVSEFLPAVVGYTIVLGVIGVTVDFETAAWWKYPVALLPLIPAGWGAAAIARHLQRVDEMQRTVLVSGMALGFGAAMVASLTFGFLGMADLDSGAAGPWIIYSVGMLGWMVGSAQANRRLQ